MCLLDGRVHSWNFGCGDLHDNLRPKFLGFRSIMATYRKPMMSMSVFERISSIFNSPSRRKDVDFTNAISSGAITGVFLLLDQLPNQDSARVGIREIARDFVHLHHDFVPFKDRYPSNTFWAFKEYLQQRTTDSVAFLDFLELLFKYQHFPYERNDFVRSINRVLQEHDCPYKLTEFVSRHEPIPVRGLSEETSVLAEKISAYPMVRLAQESVVETHAIAPVLELFTNPDFVGPDKSFRDALKRHRDGDYSGCITSCAASVEGTIRVVAKKRRWRIDGKGMGGFMKSILRKSRLPQKLQSIADFIAERRQNAGDAHGKEEAPEATEPEARFMIGLSASLIIYVASELP